LASINENTTQCNCGKAANFLMTNVPSNFLKSVYVWYKISIFCAKLNLKSAEFEMMCMKYVQKHFWREHLCALKVFLCALVSRTQLRGNIDGDVCSSSNTACLQVVL